MKISVLEALRRSVRALYAKTPTGLSVSEGKLFLSHNGQLLGEGVELEKLNVVNSDIEPTDMD